MPAEASDALSRIKRFSGQSGTLIERIRNKAAFHYDIAAMRQAYEAFPLDEWFLDYFAEAETNSFYQGAAQLSAFAALGVMKKEELRPALDRLMDEVLMVSRWVKDYVHGFMEVFLRRYVDSDLRRLLNTEVLSLSDLPQLINVHAPYFCFASRKDAKGKIA